MQADLPYDEFIATLPTRFPPKEKWRRVPQRTLKAATKKPATTAHLRVGELTGHEFMAADPCVYCGRAGQQWDHIEPLYRGGAHSGDNVARACWSCNRAKNTQKLVVFLARRATT